MVNEKTGDRLIDDLPTKALGAFMELAHARGRWARQIPPSYHNYIQTQLEWVRRAYACDEVVLASRSVADEDKWCHSICRVGAKRERHLQQFIANLDRDDRVAFRQTYHPAGSQAIRHVCGARIALTPYVDKYELVLAMASKRSRKRCAVPINVTFTTYDELLLRLVLGEFLFASCREHYFNRKSWEKTESWDDTRGSAGISPALVIPGRHVLEFEWLMGLHTDGQVLAKWLDAELEGFRNGRRKRKELDKALNDAKRWVTRVKDSGRRNSVLSKLKEGHLDLLTANGKPMLLSERIEEAKKLAKITGGVR